MVTFPRVSKRTRTLLTAADRGEEEEEKRKKAEVEGGRERETEELEKDTGREGRREKGG